MKLNLSRYNSHQKSREVSSKGLRLNLSQWKKKKGMEWENCTKLSYSQSNPCILMKTKNGTKLLNPKKNMTMKIIKKKAHEKHKLRFQATINKTLTLLFILIA